MSLESDGDLQSGRVTRQRKQPTKSNILLEGRNYFNATTSPLEYRCRTFTENLSNMTISLHGEESGLSVG